MGRKGVIIMTLFVIILGWGGHKGGGHFLCISGRNNNLLKLKAGLTEYLQTRGATTENWTLFSAIYKEGRPRYRDVNKSLVKNEKYKSA